jgi:hypothetical protein
VLGPLKDKVPPQVREADESVVVGKRGRGMALPQLRGGGKLDQRSTLGCLSGVQENVRRAKRVPALQHGIMLIQIIFNYLIN